MTPEERLLKLIRRHTAGPASEVPVQTPSPADPKAMSPLSGEARRPAAPATVELSKGGRPSWSVGGWSKKSPFLLRSLLLLAGLNLIGLIGGGITHRTRIQQIQQLLEEVSPEYSSVLGEKTAYSWEDPLSPKGAPEPYESVAPTFQGRELFRVLAAPPAPKAGPSPEKRKTVQNRLKELTLLGIVTAGDNLQAIIDDAESKKTYFLKEGEEGPDFRVMEILKGKVTLEMEGERQELTL